tara:strand:+ start:659 stop:1099 length:441 start_codon:yes stop_codon:yes gene_type:complete
MILDATKQFDIERARTRLEKLIENKSKFELTEKKPVRSVSQNAYLHLIIGWFAIEYGETIDYVKRMIFKKLVNPEIFIFERENTKTGEKRKELKSSAILDSREMTNAIDRFRDYSSKEFGVYLPEAGEIDFLNEIKTQIENNKNYL